MGIVPPLLEDELDELLELELELLEDELLELEDELEELDEELDELELDEELLEDEVRVTTARSLVTEPPPFLTTTV